MSHSAIDTAAMTGALRGMFSSMAWSGAGTVQSVWLIHHLSGQAYTHVRMIDVIVERATGEADHMVTKRADGLDGATWRVTDCFAAIGETSGTTFAATTEWGEFSLEQFSFDKWGRRVVEFTATSVGADVYSSRFRLCLVPRAIDRALHLLRYVSAGMQNA